MRCMANSVYSVIYLPPKVYEIGYDCFNYMYNSTCMIYTHCDNVN